MSETDTRESIVASLFRGEILTDQLQEFPAFEPAEAETLSIVLDSVSKFLEEKEASIIEFDAKGEQSEEYINELKNLGLFGLIIPEEYGGIGLSNAAYARVLQTSSSFDASSSLTFGAHSSIGMKGLLLFGTEEQKKKYLPDLASGEKIAAFCLTESGAGSDAASVSTNAKKNENGDWVLNGEKIWITNGAFADFFTVFAKTDSEGGKISAFIVERSFEGVSNGPKEDKLGIRASATTTVHFENVVVPKENLLGEEGKGFRVAMEILNNGRTGLGGGCTGGMKRMIALASEQASNRKQFGKAISEYELIQEKISAMTVRCFATESMVRYISHMIDSGHPDYSIEAAISKVYASESVWFSVNEALQIAGGNGFMKEYPYERFLRDCRINMIFEGTNEILRLYIGLAGLKGVGAYLKDIQSSVSNIFNEPIKGFGLLTEYLGHRISQSTMVGISELNGMPNSLIDFTEQVERMTASLARASETAVKEYKKEIVEQQLLVKNLADSAIQIFACICSLVRAKHILSDENSSDEEKDIVIGIIKMLVLDARRQVNHNLRRVEVKNEYEEVRKTSAFICKNSGYPWDVI